MAQRNSEQDAITWQTVAMRLGTQGLDLREPSDPTSLTELLNARFVDDRTVKPRSGHAGSLVQDQSAFAPLGSGYEVLDNWVYGHGLQVSPGNALAWENAHHPIAGRGATTFKYRGADVVLTGDRLLVLQGEGPASGASTYWDRANATNLDQGIPAFLPVQTDNTPPNGVSGSYVETCLTSRYRAFVTSGGNALTAWILDRDTGALVDMSEISGVSSNDVVEPKIINSGDTLVCVWRDFAGDQLWINWWTGIAWAGASAIDSGVFGFDVAVVPGGFHLAWRTTSAIKLGKYVGVKPQASPYNFGTSLDLSLASAPAGACALGVSPNGDLCVAFVGAGFDLYAGVFSVAAVPYDVWTVIGTAGFGGVSVASRGLRNQQGYFEYVIHWAGQSGGNSFCSATQFSGHTAGAVSTRWNSELASKSWRVGDEVFAWYRAANAGTHYLVSGASPQTVCGYSDREEAVSRTSHDNNYGMPTVMPDPNDALGVTFTWIRPYNTGQTYTHGGNVRYSDINFLPETCAVQYGHSVYLSGCAVRNWDGLTLGDAGFQDYPIIVGNPISPSMQTTGGNLTALGTYYFRVYAVRYNARGERFESGAVSFGPIVLTGSNSKILLSIATLPDTNHNDLTFEVYRTEALGTTYYLDGTLANSLTSALLSYSSSLADSALISQVADTHAAGVGQLSSLENWGPLGCSMLASSQDRLWGAGGQVTPGFVQFSKLHEDGSGAGFDDLAGFQEINTEGQQVTSVIAQGDATIAFETNKLYVITGTGPDNYGRGAFDIPNIVLADGAITHFGTCATPLGTLFWGDEGPRMLTNQYAVENISAPVRALSKTLSPTGVIVSLPKSEVVWYTDGGAALLWNYLDGSSRWARWNNLYIAGCSQESMITTNGRLLVEDDKATGDNGRGYPFTWCSGSIRAENLMQGGTVVRALGIVGSYKGPHKLRFRVYYNGSPLWTDEWIWEPDTNTWLASGDDFAALTPAQVDALKPVDKSGAYMTHKRLSRIDCHYLRVEVTNISADAPTYIPFELAVQVGVREGMGRVPANTFSTRIGR